MKRLALLLSFLPALAAACDVPWWLQITARDKCAAYERFVKAAEWSYARQYRVLAEFGQEFRVYDWPVLGWVEEATDCLEVKDGRCATGEFWPDFMFIRYAGLANAHPDVAEMDHLIWLLRHRALGLPDSLKAEWRHVGHANEYDPYRRFLRHFSWWLYGLDDPERLYQPAHKGCRMMEEKR